MVSIEAASTNPVETTPQLRIRDNCIPPVPPEFACHGFGIQFVLSVASILSKQSSACSPTCEINVPSHANFCLDEST